jgi:hypothetical protein
MPAAPGTKPFELVSFEDAKYPCYVMKLSKLIEIGDNFVDRKWAHELLLGRVTTHAHKYVHLPMEMNYATARFWANDFGIPIEANPPDKERSWDVVADAGGDVESALSPKGLSERDTSEESKSSNKESWFSSVCGGKKLKQSTFDGGDGSGDGNDDQERDGTTIVMNYEEFAMESDFEDGDELEESNAMGAINPMHSDKRFSHPYFVKQEKLKKKKPPKVIDPINDWFEAQWKKLSQPAVPLRKYGVYTGASISQDKTDPKNPHANMVLTKRAFIHLYEKWEMRQERKYKCMCASIEAGMATFNPLVDKQRKCRAMLHVLLPGRKKPNPAKTYFISHEWEGMPANFGETDDDDGDEEDGDDGQESNAESGDGSVARKKKKLKNTYAGPDNHRRTKLRWVQNIRKHLNLAGGSTLVDRSNLPPNGFDDEEEVYIWWDWFSVPSRDPVTRQMALYSLPFYIQTCRNFVPLVRSAERWQELYVPSEDIQSTMTTKAKKAAKLEPKLAGLPRGTMESYCLRPRSRLELFIALCPKMFNGKWRSGLFNLRFRFHEDPNDNGVGPALTMESLRLLNPVHETLMFPCCIEAERLLTKGLMSWMDKHDCDRQDFMEIVERVALQYEEYVISGSTEWDLTAKVGTKVFNEDGIWEGDYIDHRPGWLQRFFFDDQEGGLNAASEANLRQVQESGGRKGSLKRNPTKSRLKTIVERNPRFAPAVEEAQDDDMDWEVTRLDASLNVTVNPQHRPPSTPMEGLPREFLLDEGRVVRHASVAGEGIENRPRSLSARVIMEVGNPIFVDAYEDPFEGMSARERKEAQHARMFSKLKHAAKTQDVDRRAARLGPVVTLEYDERDINGESRQTKRKAIAVKLNSARVHDQVLQRQLLDDILIGPEEGDDGSLSVAGSDLQRRRSVVNESTTMIEDFRDHEGEDHSGAVLSSGDRVADPTVFSMLYPPPDSMYHSSDTSGDGDGEFSSGGGGGDGGGRNSNESEISFTDGLSKSSDNSNESVEGASHRSSMFSNENLMSRVNSGRRSVASKGSDGEGYLKRDSEGRRDAGKFRKQFQVQRGKAMAQQHQRRLSNALVRGLSNDGTSQPGEMQVTEIIDHDAEEANGSEDNEEKPITRLRRQHSTEGRRDLIVDALRRSSKFATKVKARSSAQQDLLSVRHEFADIGDEHFDGDDDDDDDTNVRMPRSRSRSEDRRGGKD